MKSKKAILLTDGPPVSSPTTFTSLYYQKAITDMYEGQQVTTVRELAPRSFDVLGWVAAHLDSGEVHFAADPDVEVIETALYLPPERRLEGHGRIAKQVWLSGYNAEVAGESFKLIETTVRRLLLAPKRVSARSADEHSTPRVTVS